MSDANPQLEAACPWPGKPHAAKPVELQCVCGMPFAASLRLAAGMTRISRGTDSFHVLAVELHQCRAQSGQARSAVQQTPCLNEGQGGFGGTVQLIPRPAMLRGADCSRFVLSRVVVRVLPSIRQTTHRAH